MSDEILNNIKTRRVVREMTDEGVEREQIETILEAGRWAPTAAICARSAISWSKIRKHGD